MTFVWNPAEHATYCPQHYPPPADGGGSSWLCNCSGPLVELRAAGQALIDVAVGQVSSNSWAEAFDVWQDIVAEQERLEAAAEACGGRGAEQERLEWEAADLPWNPDDLRDPDASCEEADLPANERRRVAAEDRAAEVRLYGEEHVARLEKEANRG